MRVFGSIALCAAAVAAFSLPASSASLVTDYQFRDTGIGTLVLQPSATDGLNGLAGTIEAGSFYQASSGNLIELTDGDGAADGLNGLMNDFTPAVKISYNFASPVTVWSATVFSANNDERVFQTYDVEVFKTGELDYTYVGRVQTGPFNRSWSAVGSPNAAVTRLRHDDMSALAQNVEAIRFTFYPVGNTQNYYQMPESSNVGSWIREIDVTVVPEPASLVALGAGLTGLVGLLRRSR